MNQHYRSDLNVALPVVTGDYDPLSLYQNWPAPGTVLFNLSYKLYQQRIDNRDVLTELVLPNNSSLRFKYNQFGEVAEVEMPAGGKVRYDYGSALALPAGNSNFWEVAGDLHTSVASVDRAVKERRIYPTGAITPTAEATWSYTYGTSAEVIARAGSLTGNIVLRQKHYFLQPLRYTHGPTFGNPDGTYYSKWTTGVEWRTETLDASGSVLAASEHDWTQRAPVVWSSYVQEQPANDNRVNEERKFLDTGASAKVQFLYDQYNNPVEIKEYDYDQSLKRKRLTNYVTSSTPINGVDYTSDAVHLLRLPRETLVYDGGANLFARSEFRYDEISYPLMTYGPLTGWTEPTTTARGNATTSRQWLNMPDSWIESHVQYDQCGSVRKTWDARGNLNEVEYSSTYHRSYPTLTISPVPDPTGQTGSNTSLTTSSTFDFDTGLITSTTDQNNQTTSYDYNDPFNRLKNVTRPLGGGTTSYSYSDSAGNQYVQEQIALDGARVIESYRYFDGLGRPHRTYLNEGGGVYLVTDTQYDSVGRVWQVSNPYRTSMLNGSINPPGLWTTTLYDGLGRVSTVTTVDSAVVSTSYTGNIVTVSDQTGKQRRSVTDALGRIILVYEAPNDPTLTYLTNYSYDVLDNLADVTQGAQTRTFVYDSLKRLRSASNPESGTITYQYDNNGNLTQKTDARGVSTTYAYDALNRSTTINYSDTSTINPDITRVYDGAINGRGRFWYSYAGGSLTVGANVEHTAMDSYDALGRPLVQRQLFKTNSVWGPTYQTSRVYNLAGGVTSQTYPSGHTVTYNFDHAGRLADKDAQNLAFAGNLGDGVNRTYSRGLVYSLFGGVAKEQLGTDTPLYNKSFYNSRGQLAEILVSTSYSGPTDFTWNRGKIINHYSAQCSGMCGGESSNQSMPDNNGNLKKQDVLIPHNDQVSSFTQWQQQYDYDNLNRLISISEVSGSVLWQQQFGYDRYGNRTINAAQTWGTGINNKQFTINVANNRLGVPAGQSGVMTYDNVGNLLTDSYSGFGSRTYDAENRMTSAQDSYGQWSYYTYNADGQRTRRKINNQESSQVYGFDGELLAEYAVNGSPIAPQKEYGYRSGQLLVTAEMSGGSASAPSNLGVTAATAGQINLSWTQPSGASNYRVERRPAGGSYGLAGTTSATTFGDAGVSAGNAYLYRVCAADGQGNCTSGYSNAALGAAVNFTDDPLTLGVTLVKAQHVTELRQTVNAIRSLAGLAAATWTDPNPSMVIIKVVHVQELRDRLNEALTVLEIQTSSYTDPTLTGAPNGTLVKRVHFAELRQRTTSGIGGAGGGGSVLNIQWLVTDHLGTPRMIFDKSGSLANTKRHDYLPFGEELFANQGLRTTTLGYSGGDGIRQQFTSKERDNETGLDFFGARYYGSMQGRFTSPDPLMASAYVENPQSWNRYSYALNNPLKYIDPDGMKTEPVFGAYKDLTDEERRILENSKVKVGKEVLSGQKLYDALANGSKDQQKGLASFLNQTAVLSSVTFSNGRSAISYVSNVIEFRQDRIIANVDSGFIDQVRNESAKDSDAGKRYVGPENSGTLHGDFNTSFRENFREAASQQLSFNSKLKFAAADIDIDEECPVCGSAGSSIKHAGRVVKHRLFGGKTDPYGIYDRLTQRKIQPSYQIKK